MGPSAACSDAMPPAWASPGAPAAAAPPAGALAGASAPLPQKMKRMWSARSQLSRRGAHYQNFARRLAARRPADPFHVHRVGGRAFTLARTGARGRAERRAKGSRLR